MKALLIAASIILAAPINMAETSYQEKALIGIWYEDQDHLWNIETGGIMYEYHNPDIISLEYDWVKTYTWEYDAPSQILSVSGPHKYSFRVIQITNGRMTLQDTKYKNKHKWVRLTKDKLPVHQRQKK